MRHIMNPYHRTVANNVLEYCNTLIKLSEVWDIWLRNRKRYKHFDYYMFIDGKNILIGWKDVHYGFMIYPEENRVQVTKNV